MTEGGSELIKISGGELGVVVSGKREDPQSKLVDVCDWMKDLLLYKNKNYGNVGLEPINVLSKVDSLQGLLHRADDKIARLKNNPDPVPRLNDIMDLCGYCILIMTAMGAKKEDFEKQKD